VISTLAAGRDTFANRFKRDLRANLSHPITGRKHVSCEKNVVAPGEYWSYVCEASMVCEGIDAEGPRADVSSLTFDRHAEKRNICPTRLGASAGAATTCHKKPGDWQARGVERC